MKIKITADSTCDLPQELLAAHNVLTTPLMVLLGDKSYADWLEIAPPRIYAYMEAHKDATCHTSACNTATYRNTFSQLQNYDAVIHISLSAKISSSYANAVQAAVEFPNVYVVDSNSLCAGSGLLVERAARLIAAGRGPAEIIPELKRLSHKVEGHCILNTLEYVRRGGRCSAVSEWGANLLQMKLCIEVKDGSLRVGKKYRGAFAHCAKKYLADYLQDRQDIVPDTLYFANISCDPLLLAEAREMLEGLHYFKRIVNMDGGCVIGSHSGPGAVGMFYERK